MIKIAKAIYNAPLYSAYYDEDYGNTIIWIKYENHIFQGESKLHKDDEGFYSQKIGYNIALSRARQKALTWALGREIARYNMKNTFYQEVLGYGRKESAEIDPTGAFNRNLKHSQSRIAALEKIIKDEKKWLAEYLVGQDKALESIKRLRRKDNTN